MSSGPPPSAGPSNQSAQRAQVAQQHATQASAQANIYSFSVHQPYTNWPLHASGPPYAPSWYPLHPTSYNQPRTYRENYAQTELSKSNEDIPEKEKFKYRQHWDSAVSAFLESAGLYQALHGFREDMMVLNDVWEKENVPAALQSLVDSISKLMSEAKDEALLEKPLEERKLDYIRPQSGVEPQTPTSFTRSISYFLRDSRRRNDASNRAEFLQSLAEKRRRLAEQRDSNVSAESITTNLQEGKEPMGPGLPIDTEQAENININVEAPIPSCARTDAKPQNRDVQMKYDIAKNEDGPLKRTMKRKNRDDEPTIGTTGGTPGDLDKRRRGALNVSDDAGQAVTAVRHPGLAERFRNIEIHLAVRYVPSPPHSLLDRIQFLENHVIKLEKDYPPWAALHFNQPNRGWPPPPRLTPIIVPTHLTSSDPDGETSAQASTAQSGASGSGAAAARGTGTGNTGGNTKGKNAARQKSSLHRAVMEKLEIQRAMGDLASPSPSSTFPVAGRSSGGGG